MAHAEFSESEALVAKVKNGDLEGLKEDLRAHPGGWMVALTTVYKDEDATEGALLNLAIHHGKAHVVSFLFEELKGALGNSKAASELTLPTFFAFQEEKYTMVEHLLSLGVSPNLARPSDGNTLLHLCCDRRKPVLRIIRKLLQTKGCNPNLTNKSGDMALHLLAQKCFGPEGRDVITLLKMKGARLDVPSSSGQTAMQMTKNSHIRQALGFSSALRQRELPELSPREKQGITVEEIMTTEVETPRELKEKRVSMDEYSTLRRSTKKLTPEEQEELNKRMVTVCMESAKRKTEALLLKYVKDPERTVLTAEELEKFTTRHYYDQVEAQNSRLSQLMEKYVTEMVPSSQLTEEEMQASAQRLHTESMAHSAATIQKLVQQYVRDPSEELASNPPTPFTRPPKKAPKAKIEKACADMYYRSLEYSKKHAADLVQRYLPDKEDVKKLTPQEVAAMGERLHKSGKG